MTRWAAPAAAIIVAGIGGCATEPGADHLKWSLTPTVGTISPGGQVNFTINVKSKANINSDLELSASPVPNGLYLTLPATVTSTANTVSGSFYPSPGMELGLYEIEINVREKGTEYGLPEIFKLTVTGGAENPDFAVEVDPSIATIAVEGGKTFTFRVAPLNGFTGTVSVGLGELPDDITLASGPTPASLTFAPGEGSKGGTFVLRYTPTPPVPATVDLMLTVTDGGITHTRTITLTLPSSVSAPG